MLPSLNIVIYTDYPEWFSETPLSPEGGLKDLSAFIKDKTKQFVNVDLRFVSRHEPEGTKFITEELLQGVDELWVFGRRMADRPPEEPDNELKPEEVALLQQYISEKRIGIFLTGDHSESESGAACDGGPHADYSSLGRALGENIPIAGLLRDWEGPPSNCNEVDFELRDNFNTQEGDDPCGLDSEGLQSDERPQTIILKLKNCRPHRLFTYADSNQQLRLITKLPDHAHEGRVLDIEEVRERSGDKWKAEWPDPVVAAQGRDKRFPLENRISNLVVAFDGDSAELSRMVVDSSFHHYLDDNLLLIPSRLVDSKLPQPDSDLDQIAQYFGNLALWLAPKAIRDQINFDILLSLSRHNAVRQVWNHSDVKVGRVAREVLYRTIGQGRLQWLFGANPFEERDPIDAFFSIVFLTDQDTSLFSRIIKPELPLAIALRICDHFIVSNRITDVTSIKEHQPLRKLLEASLFVTLDLIRDDFSKLAPVSSAALTNSLTAYRQAKGEEIMARRCHINWDSYVDPTDPTTPNNGKIFIDEMNGQGHLRGRHRKDGHDYPLEGECNDNPHHIEFDTDEGFHYEGLVFDVGNQRFAVGTRSAARRGLRDKSKGGKEIDGEEVWVGVKTT
jgi:hypothetical protein